MELLKLIFGIIEIAAEIGAIGNSRQDIQPTPVTPKPTIMAIIDVQVVDEANNYITQIDQQYLSYAIRSQAHHDLNHKVKFIDFEKLTLDSNVQKNGCLKEDCLDDYTRQINADLSMQTTIRFVNDSLKLKIEVATKNSLISKHILTAPATEDGKLILGDKTEKVIKEVLKMLERRLNSNSNEHIALYSENPTTNSQDSIKPDSVEFTHKGFNNDLRIAYSATTIAANNSSLQYSLSYNNFGILWGCNFYYLFLFEDELLPSFYTGFLLKSARNEFSLQYERSINSSTAYSFQYFRDFKNKGGFGFNFILGVHHISEFDHTTYETISKNYPYLAFGLNYALF